MGLKHSTQHENNSVKGNDFHVRCDWNLAGTKSRLAEHLEGSKTARAHPGVCKCNAAHLPLKNSEATSAGAFAADTHLVTTREHMEPKERRGGGRG